MSVRLLTLLSAVCAAALLHASDEPAPKARADFSSHPSGATVLVDGRERGVTPLSLWDLEPGRHRVKFRLKGYEDLDLVSEAVVAQVLQNSVMLEPVKGILLLRSEPEGCDIAIDGASVGTTPRLITNLDAKDVHRITLRKAGYCQSSLDIRFEGRKPLVRTEKMVLDSGIVAVTTEPAGAEVSINGIARGTTPVEVRDVPKGRATIRVSLKGFATETRELAIKAGDSQTLSLALKGLPGTLTVSSVPEGARFYIDGQFRGKSYVTVPDLAAGEHMVRAELEGYGTVDRKVVVDNGGSVNEEFRLTNLMGRLEVRSSPAGAQVIMDGKVVGTTTSKDPDAEFSDILPINDLLEGEHTLVLRLEGYADTTRHPKIQNSKTSQAKVRLKRIFKPDIRIETETGTVEGLFVSSNDEFLVIEVKPGIQNSYRRSEIKKFTYLNK